MRSPPRANLEQLLGVISQREEAVCAYLKDTSEGLSNSKLLKRFGRRLNDLRIELKAIDYSEEQHQAEAQLTERLEPPEGAAGLGSSEAAKLRARYSIRPSVGRPLSELIAERKRLVLLGDPGSGKTELLRSHAAKTAQTGWEDLESGKVQIDDVELPIFLPLKLLATSLKEPKFPNLGSRPCSPVLTQRCLDFWSESLEKFLDDNWLARTPAGISNKEFFAAWLLYSLGKDSPLNPRLLDWMWSRLSTGAASIYLDGWDEISDGLILRSDECRNIISDKLEEFVKETGCRVIVSSRVVGYNQSLFTNDGEDALERHSVQPELRVEPFRWEETRAFVKSWFKENESTGARMLSELRIKDSVSGLASNPLMATLLCQAFSPGAGRILGFPFRRIDVYKRIIEGFLGEWALAREVQGEQVYGDLESENRIAEKLGFLSYAARQMYMETSVFPSITFAKLRNYLNDYLKSDLGEAFRIDEKAHWRINEDSINALCTTLSGLIAGELIKEDGLFVKTHKDVYQFLHLTFFEYLVARSMSGTDLCDVAGQRNFEEWWEVGLMSGELHAKESKDEAWEFVSTICQKPHSKKGRTEDYNYQLAWLSGQIMLDNGLIVDRTLRYSHRVQLRRVRNWLKGSIYARRLNVIYRVMVGMVLGAIGDPRFGVGNDQNGVPEMRWIAIKAGEFIMGDEAWGEFSCRLITEDYRISAYLVTNQQYQRFLDDPGGYSGEQWWKGLAWKPGDSDAPANFGSVLEHPNHPRVGVNWYESLAFCRWLTARLRHLEKLSKHEEITLPSEAQWERAARGEQGAIYPWGDDTENIENRCNCYRSQLGITSAVGLFPVNKSVSSLYDAVGNVFEWTMTKFMISKRNPYRNYSPNNAPGGKKPRILRGGGSYDYPMEHSADHLRCANWAATYAYLRGNESKWGSGHNGFRVVRKRVLR